MHYLIFNVMYALPSQWSFLGCLICAQNKMTFSVILSFLCVLCLDMQLERKISVKKRVGPPVAVKKRIVDVENQPISGKCFFHFVIY
jgi:hypothetical protein